MKLGSVTVGGVFKGILVEVEYCPGVVPNNCWGILLEFMQVGKQREEILNSHTGIMELHLFSPSCSLAPQSSILALKPLVRDSWAVASHLFRLLSLRPKGAIPTGQLTRFSNSCFSIHKFVNLQTVIWKVSLFQVEQYLDHFNKFRQAAGVRQ